MQVYLPQVITRAVKLLDQHFEVQGRNSTILTEIFAGITTYLSLSFVFILNPAILGAALPDRNGVSMAPASVLLATILTSGCATIAMGVLANLPLAVGPGIEVSAFFTYILVRQMGLSWEEALFAVVISGALNVLFTRASYGRRSYRERIVEAIPSGLKSSLLLVIGVFVVLVGFKLGGVVDIDTHTRFLFLRSNFWQLPQLEQGPLVLAVGLVFSALFNIKLFRLPLGPLIGIAAGGLTCYIAGIHAPVSAPPNGGSWFQTFLQVRLPDEGHLLAFLNGVIILFVVDFVGGISKIYALTADTRISAPGEKVPGLKWALFVDGGATFFGGLLGTSSLIAFVESRIGIEAGGVTGITAIVCGCLMLAGGIFSKLAILVPPQAAAGVLVYVGILLISLNAKLLKQHLLGKIDVAIAAIMCLSVVVSFQMDYAMLFGFAPYYFIARKRGLPFRSTLWLGIVALALLVTIVPQGIAITDAIRGISQSIKHFEPTKNDLPSGAH